MQTHLKDNISTYFKIVAATSALGLSFYLYRTPQIKAERNKKESVYILNPNEQNGESKIIRNIRTASSSDMELISTFENCSSLTQYISYCVEQHSDKPFIGSRRIYADGRIGDYEYISYEQAAKLSSDLASGIKSLVTPSIGIHAGFFAGNSEQWKIAEFACYHSSHVVISLYETLGPNSIEYIIEHGDIELIYTSLRALPKLISALEELQKRSLLRIKNIIVLDSLSTCTEMLEYLSKNEFPTIESLSANNLDFSKLHSRIEQLNVKLWTIEQLIHHGQSLPIHDKSNDVSPNSNTLATIMYTSGTTGQPKGVMLTHGALLASIAGFSVNNRELDPSVHPIHYLSYLPLAHIMERISHFNFMLFGANLGFYKGDVRALFQEFVSYKPTFIVGAPRVFQRIYDSVMNQVNQGGVFSKWLFQTAYEAKRKALEEGRTTPIYDRLVFSKWNQKIFGGNAKVIVSGGAPLSPKVHEFLRICFTPSVGEGYGLTETTAGACIHSPKYVASGNVGAPLPSLEIKLKNVPEMGYYVDDLPNPRGELCVRGGCVTSGYYKDPEKTKEAFDASGWFLTGDIAQLNKNGTITIIDRKKNIFKLNQGEYITPERLENIYCRSSLVAQCFVYGDSLESFLVAIVVPDEMAIRASSWVKDHGKQNVSMKDLCSEHAIKDMILNDMERVGKEAKIMGFEMVKNIYVESEPWTIDNDMLTPTMKTKRYECAKKYTEIFKSLYQQQQQ